MSGGGPSSASRRMIRAISSGSRSGLTWLKIRTAREPAGCFARVRLTRKSRSTVLRALGVLAGIIDVAVDDNRIATNPARNLRTLPQRTGSTWRNRPRAGMYRRTPFRRSPLGTATPFRRSWPRRRPRFGSGSGQTPSISLPPPGWLSPGIGSHSPRSGSRSAPSTSPPSKRSLLPPPLPDAHTAAGNASRQGLPRCAVNCGRVSLWRPGSSGPSEAFWRN